MFMNAKKVIAARASVLCALAHLTMASSVTAAQEVKGKVTVTALQDYCPQKSECAPGEICDVAIRISGNPAKMLLRTLKGIVKVDPQLEELGLPIYESKDGLISCLDETEPFCDMRLNVAKATLEHIPLCE